MSSARLRFSYCAVAVGNVPSTGNALTGRSSPSPAVSLPSTSFTNCGALGVTGGNNPPLPFAMFFGTGTGKEMLIEWIT